ncbi:MAG: hypothetical protein JXR56_00675 [Candidatus Cloacimonetes bacterium]|nr:hypothetical protein [Candidatus Cloacimonadota bacterium]
MRKVLIATTVIIISFIMFKVMIKPKPKLLCFDNYRCSDVIEGYHEAQFIQEEAIRIASHELLKEQDKDFFSDMIAITSVLNEDNLEFVDDLPVKIAGFYVKTADVTNLISANNSATRKVPVFSPEQLRVQQREDLFYKAPTEAVKYIEYTDFSINLDITINDQSQNPFGLSISSVKNIYVADESVKFEYMIEKSGYVTLLSYYQPNDVRVIVRANRKTPAGEYYFPTEFEHYNTYPPRTKLNRNCLILLVTPERLVLTDFKQAQLNTVYYRPLTLKQVESEVSKQDFFSVKLIPCFVN